MAPTMEFWENITKIVGAIFFQGHLEGHESLILDKGI